MKAKIIKKACLISLIATAFTSCNGDKITGSWVQPIPGQENSEQGIKLDENGSASSINMNTLTYDSWKKEGNNLILTGKSIGNGGTFNFADTFNIKKLTATELILSKDAFETSYTRK